MTSVATNEPLEARAGLNWRWDRNDLSADYPAPTWTLTYYFKNASANFSFAAAANGVYFSVTRTAAQTAALVAGNYDWIAVVSDGTNKNQVDNGRLTLRPDFTLATSLDGRSQAAKAVDDLKTALATFNATSGRTKRYHIGTREMEFETSAEILKMLSFWEIELGKETAASNLAKGLGNPRRTTVRFDRA